MTHYTEAMLDIETLSTKPNAAILSVAVVRFNIRDEDTVQTLSDPDRSLHVHLPLPQQKLLERDFDPSTIMFWLGQEDQARNAILTGQKGADFAQNLIKVKDFLRSVGKLWGNGSDFDNVILRSLFDDVDEHFPVRYSGNRCLRTLRSLVPGADAKSWPWPKGLVKHDALDDAKNQVLVAQHCWRKLNGGSA